MGWEYHNRQRDCRGRFKPLHKTDRVQIRCTDRQRAEIQARANARFMTMSEYLLDLVQRDLLRDRYDITVDGKKT